MDALVEEQIQRNRQSMVAESAEEERVATQQDVTAQPVQRGDVQVETPSDIMDLDNASEDCVSVDLWLEALKAPAVTISDLTPNFHNAYAEAMWPLITDALAFDDESEEGMQAWWKLLLTDKLLFHKGGEPGESLNSKLRGRFQAVKDGEWLDLVSELLEESGADNQKKIKSEAATAKRVEALAKQNSWRRAIACLRSSAGPDRSMHAWDKLQAELPEADTSCSCGSGEVPLTDEERRSLRDRILRRIRSADGATSAGLHGSSANMWKVLVRDDDVDLTELVLDMFERVAVGRISPGIRRVLMHSDLLAVPRPDGRYRPVEVPSFIRKIAIGALMDVIAPEANSAAGPHQHGLRSPDGCVLAYSVLEHALRLNPKLVVASVDVSGAHSNIRRDKAEEICNEEAPRLGHLLRLWYHEPSPKTWRGTTSRSRTSSTGVGQGFPEAGPIFCAGLGRGIRNLTSKMPSTKVVAFQDDTYLIDTMEGIVSALGEVRRLWGELGLKVNDVKLKLYTVDTEVRSSAPPELKTKFVDSLAVLGQRLALKLEDGGLDFTLVPGGSGLSRSLCIASQQLRGLAERLRQVVQSGLPVAVAHRIWVFASSGAITHLQAAEFCDATSMLEFHELQVEHVRWMTGRQPSARDIEVSMLTCKEGGMGLPDYTVLAMKNFLAAQTRVLPGVCSALSIPTVEELIRSRPGLEQTLSAAKSGAVERGAPIRKVPQPSSAAAAGGCKQKMKACTRAMQRAAREKVAGNLGSSQKGRLKAQGRSGTSLWLQEVLPEGEAPADETWAAMIRHRLLMPAPGSSFVPEDTRQCAHTGQRGCRCSANVDDEGVHEALCNLGGGPSMRHNRVREWLVDKLRESFGGKTLTERPHPTAGSTDIGRMDIKHDSAFGHFDIDVTIVSISTSNVRECLRRQRDPERALRAGVREKLVRYGAGVLAFAVDDAGGISAGAVRLLRRMAQQVAGENGSAMQLLKWRAELQHVVLQATAGMMQAARGVPRTA